MSDRRALILPESVLAPLKQLAALYREYGSVPRAIAGIISLYVVNSILSIGGFGVSIVLEAWRIVTSSLDIARQLLVGAFGAVGIEIMSIYREIIAVVAETVASLGPFGPPVAIAVGSLSLYGTYRLLIVLLGELPVGSSIVDLLGLR